MAANNVQHCVLCNNVGLVLIHVLYISTGLSASVHGFSMIKFFHEEQANSIGSLCPPPYFYLRC